MTKEIKTEIEIEYCAAWSYTDRATSLVAELLAVHEFEIDRLSLIPSKGGAFEVTVGGELLYSKLQTERHAKEGEVLELVKQKLKQ